MRTIKIILNFFWLDTSHSQKLDNILYHVKAFIKSTSYVRILLLLLFIVVVKWWLLLLRVLQ